MKFGKKNTDRWKHSKVRILKEIYILAKTSVVVQIFKKSIFFKEPSLKKSNPNPMIFFIKGKGAFFRINKKLS